MQTKRDNNSNTNDNDPQLEKILNRILIPVKKKSVKKYSIKNENKFTKKRTEKNKIR